MKTLVYTIAQNGYATAFLPCIASQRAYAKRIGADYVVITKPRRVTNTALSAWLKIPIMQRALKAGYDWVVYIDADCEVKSNAPNITEFFATEKEEILMAVGRTGRVNSGVIFARNGNKSRDFLDQVMQSATQSIPEEDRASLKYENGNVIYVHRVNGGVGVIGPEWNNASDPEMDDYIRHYTGKMRSLLRRSLWREIQFQTLRRVSWRQFVKFQRQPERRELEFVKELNQLADNVQQEYPALVAS